MDQDEIFEDTWEIKEDEALPYFKNEILSTSFSYAKNTKRMEELTVFGRKNSITLPSLAYEYLNSLSDGTD